MSLHEAQRETKHRQKHCLEMTQSLKERLQLEAFGGRGRSRADFSPKWMEHLGNETLQ